MATIKVAVTIDEDILRRIDQLVEKKVFANRSQAFQAALDEKLARVQRTRLATECAKLDTGMERKLADEGLGHYLDAWPGY